MIMEDRKREERIGKALDANPVFVRLLHEAKRGTSIEHLTDVECVLACHLVETVGRAVDSVISP